MVNVMAAGGRGGYEVDSGDLRVQANRDWDDAYELDGCAGDLGPLRAPASSGAAESAELTEAISYALGLFQNVYRELSDGASILGSSEQSAATGYDTTDSVSATTYQRMGAS